MAVGFLSGLVAGAVVSGLALGAVSIAIGPQAAGPGPDAAALDVPGGSGFNQSRDDTVARLPQADGAPELVGDTPQVAAAAPDNLSQVAAADTAPTARPEISSPQTDLMAPDVMDEGSGMPMVAMDAPMAEGATPVDLGTGDMGSPDIPSAEGAGDVSISADPAQPSLPEVEGGASFDAAAPEPQEVPDQAPEQTESADDAAPQMQLTAETPDPGDTPSGTIGNIAKGIETQRLPSLGTPSGQPTLEPAADDVATLADLPPIWTGSA